MVTIEQIAAAALADDPLEVRSLVQEFQRQPHVLADVQRPAGASREVLIVAAGIAELLAQRTGQDAPAWTAEVGSFDEPRFLVKAALRSPKMRERVGRESPEPLRSRNVYAPPGYLEVV